MEMDTEVQCIVLNGANLIINTIKLNNDTGCKLNFEASVENCNSNWDEFLRLAWYDESTDCFSFEGISYNNGKMGFP